MEQDKLGKMTNYFHALKYKVWLSKQKRELKKKGIRYGKNLYLYNVKFDSVAGYLIRIGNNCILTNCTILAHDDAPRMYFPYRKIDRVIIGNNCFIGYGALILPGVKIGNNVIVAAGSIVTHDIPSNTIVAGCPAKVINTISDYKKKIKREINTAIIVNKAHISEVEKERLFVKLKNNKAFEKAQYVGKEDVKN